ncbi:tail fiber domain-containing protein [Bacteroidota bacterium]
MVRKTFLFCLVFALSISMFAQVPDAFKYQAVVRNSSGEILPNQDISLRTSILDGSATGTNVFAETHAITTNDLGMISISIGIGTLVSGDFGTINWSTGDKYLKVEIDENGGSSFTDLGAVELLSVPYAFYAVSSKNLGDENIYSPATDTLFVVKDHDGNVVFAVFPDGAQLIVNEQSKGKVGGFAISGRSPGKAVDEDYLIVTPDSTRIYVNDTSQTKGKVGGFAISGRSPSKGTLSSLMDLTQENYFIGHEAGINTTTGQYNSFFGYEAGYENTEGEENIFIGFESGYSNIDGFENVFIGNGAGHFNGSGYDNIYIGNWAGFNNDTASYNVFIGNSAGYNNTLGSSNVFIGDAAGETNTIGEANIFLGDWAGAFNTEGNENVFLGNEAGWSNTLGNYNVFLGSETGHSNLTGEENVFLGTAAGYGNTTGDYNIFIGSETGYSNTIGEGNVFIGDDAGYENTVGNNNVFIGDVTGNSNTIGEYNVFIGSEAGLNNEDGNWNCFLGSGTGYNNITGFGNIFMGDEAGYSNENGNDNVYLGSESGYSNIEGSENVFIGTGAGYYETSSSKLYIENSDTDSTDALIYGNFEDDFLRINYLLGVGRNPESNELEVEGEASKTIAGGFIANSDRRIKTDIQEITNARELLLKLHPVRFKYTNSWRQLHPTIKDQYYYNFIAQEYQKVFPESVKGSNVFIDGDTEELLQLDSYNAQIVTIKAVQELIDENAELRKENEEIKNRLTEIEDLLKKE